MLGVRPKGRGGIEPSSLTAGEVVGRELVLMAAMGKRAGRIVRQKERAEALHRARSSRWLEVGDQVLVLKGAATSMTMKWPIDKSKFYGPCRVVNAKHPRYILESSKGRYTCRAIHARRLIPFIQKPASNVGD